jgi:hypothetical protein
MNPTRAAYYAGSISIFLTLAGLYFYFGIYYWLLKLFIQIFGLYVFLFVLGIVIVSIAVSVLNRRLK